MRKIIYGFKSLGGKITSFTLKQQMGHYNKEKKGWAFMHWWLGETLLNLHFTSRHIKRLIVDCYQFELSLLHYTKFCNQ